MATDKKSGRVTKTESVGVGDAIRLKRASVFTTGAVAILCNVAPRTVSKWTDAGRLKAYRMPGSRDRRVERADLIWFMREQGIPGWEAISPRSDCVAVGVSEAVADGIAGLDGWVCHAAADLLSAGLAMGSAKNVRAVVVDLSVGGREAVLVAKAAMALPKRRGEQPVTVIGLCSDTGCEDREALTGAGFARLVPGPATPGAVMELLLSGGRL